MRNSGETIDKDKQNTAKASQFVKPENTNFKKNK